ncbi:hypothetical protein RFI_34932, partial [Reticulomyxa filosa]
MKEMKDNKWEIPSPTQMKQELKSRKDVRHLRTLTFVSSSFDGGLSIEMLGDCKYRVGIHVPDISYFVKPNTPLDMHAKRRAMAVHLTNHTIPIWPSEFLSTLACFNNTNDYLAYSVFLVVNKNGAMLRQEESPWFGRTVVTPRARLCGKDVARLVNTDPHLEKDYPTSSSSSLLSNKDVDLDVVSDVRQLYAIAQKRQMQRTALAAKEPSLSQLCFVMNDDQMSSIVDTNDIEMQCLIGELTMLANKQVAKQ